MGKTELSNILSINLIFENIFCKDMHRFDTHSFNFVMKYFAFKTSQISFTQQTSGHVLFEEIKQNLRAILEL